VLVKIAHRWNKGFEWELKLPGLTKKIREAPAITKLLTVFQVYDSEPATVASFGKIGGLF
jgi:hypothetical protein